MLITAGVSKWAAVRDVLAIGHYQQHSQLSPGFDGRDFLNGFGAADDRQVRGS